MGRRALLAGRAPLHLLLLCHAWALPPPPPRDTQPVLPARLPAPPGQLALRLAAFGRAVVLRLRPDTTFLAPRLRLQRLGGRRPPTPPRRGCFYAGAVEGSPDAPAVLSSCGGGGLRAAFLLDGAAYELQPLGPAAPGPPWGRLHRLRRRAAPPGARPASPGPEPGPRRRAPRFVSQARYVETLLVADASMVRFYGEDVENHILTLMSMAARIYKHPSLRNSISLVVVKVLVVEEAAAGPEVSDNGGLTLRNFCSWQQRFNPPSDRHPEHYDTAILLTRQDFCGHQSCDTLGVADIGTMCDRNKSCSVIEDEGLQAAYTLAHELGNTGSLPEGRSASSTPAAGRGRGTAQRQHLLAGDHPPTLEGAAQGGGEVPIPGVVQEMPGAGTQCSGLGDKVGISRRLDLRILETQELLDAYRWCPTPSAEEQGLGWGAQLCHPCAPQAMCSACPTTTPRTASGSSGPWGQRAKYQSCHTQECPPDGKSFREQQCEKYNSYNFTDLEGNHLEWVPKYAGVSPRDRCKLFCRARGRSEFKVFEAKVIDGTLCGPETLSICVHGQCIKAGCDHVIGSSKKLDKCGVCGGNGSTCRKISGSYGYNDIVTIPAGATNIDIKQRSHRGLRHDGNYLALKTLEGKYLLNGDFAISAMEQDILIKGTILKYSGSMTTLERLQSFRQLPEPLTVQLLTIASELFPPKVKYTFFIPKDVPFSKQKGKEKKSVNVIRPMLTSQWVLGDWSECSKTCGSGWQRRTVDCRDVEGQTSSACNRSLKPEDIKPCGDVVCPMLCLRHVNITDLGGFVG
uniref:Peptidase M12B domain-containing protein n=1 Tax=Zonotrichia albicollis TaxID=44394 RepID=A0A8D2NJH6_ZONAL